MSLFNIALTLSCCLLLITFLYGIGSRKLRKNQLIRRYLLYLGFFLCIELARFVSIYIVDIKTINYIYIFYVVGEFFLLFHFFQKTLVIKKIWQIVIALIASCFFLETVVLWFVYGDSTIGFSKVISHIIIVIAVALILVKNLKELEEKNPLLPLHAALLFYYAASIFLFLIMNQLTESTSYIWSINNVMSSILYGSSIYTFYQLRKLY